MKALVIGGGFAGCTIAHLLHREGWQVDLVEKEPHLGGGCRTFFYGDHPYTNGPRVYYGYSDKVFNWLHGFTPIRRFPFELKTYVESDRRFYTYPIHELDLPTMPDWDKIQYELCERDNSKEPADFEQYWLQRIGRTLYDKFVNYYSKKMWMIDDNKMFDIFKWSAKDKPIETGTREAYKGSYLGYPVAHDGYNQYFEKMTEGVHVEVGRKWKAGAYPAGYDQVISTIPIDELCDYRFGELPYVGRDFSVFILPCRQVFPGDVRFCHYAGSEPWTRITEFKKITYHESEDTLLVAEKPSHSNNLYPYLTKANEAKVRQYLDCLPSNVHSIGRLGTYKYSTIEQTIVQAFQCAAKILGKPNELVDEWREIGDTSLIRKDRKL